jgi:predicted nuclease of predicted toxin-antitoxin system
MEKPGLLLDENIGHLVADSLRSEGFDVLSILESNPGTKDIEVLKQAAQARRILITLDKDFGRLVFQSSQKHVGVIFLRLEKESPENIKNILLKILMERVSQLQGKFATVTESTIRIK